MITKLPVTQENYAETMVNVVEPFLRENGEEGFFDGFDGNKIHYESYKAIDPKGVIVISHGFTESAEKFHEVSYNFVLMGFNVFAIDHRGHGKSFRLTSDPATVSVDRFEDYVKDLKILVKSIVLPSSDNLPLYLYSHSMGGAVAIQYLQQYPGDFKKAVLSAPMVLPQCNGMSPGVARALTTVLGLFGNKHKMVFVYNGFNPNYSFEDSNDTSKERFDYYHKKRLDNDIYKTSCASYRWVSEAVKVSKKNLDSERCKKITIPVLVCKAQVDKSVYGEKEDEFVNLLPNGRLVQFEGSRHEIYASGDETLLKYYQTIESFLDE